MSPPLSATNFYRNGTWSFYICLNLFVGKTVFRGKVQNQLDKLSHIESKSSLQVCLLLISETLNKNKNRIKVTHTKKEETQININDFLGNLRNKECNANVIKLTGDSAVFCISALKYKINVQLVITTKSKVKIWKNSSKRSLVIREIVICVNILDLLLFPTYLLLNAETKK